jgi:hypothetical protein
VFHPEKTFLRLKICGFLIITRNNNEKIIKNKIHDDLIGDLTYINIRTDVYKPGKGREKTSLILA